MRVSCSRRWNPSHDPQNTFLHRPSIFFVHGFGGGPTKSWRHPENGTIWFRDLLPQYVADREHQTNARIWTFGYNSGLFNSTRASIYDYANQLLSRVAGVREDHEHYKIIWVCHSLGGLVVKSVSGFCFYELCCYSSECVRRHS